MFERLCGLQCSLNEIAYALNCSEDTVERWCKREYTQSFADVYKVYSASGKISLRRYQFELAKKSAAMAIFLGKNYLGQRDEAEVQRIEIDDASRSSLVMALQAVAKDMSAVEMDVPENADSGDGE